jgi:DNA-binding response OmpR family regulator
VTSTSQARLLIVEDDDELAALLEAYLRQEGFEIARVSRGDAGAEAILGTNPDLVILDLMLPGLDGLDVCRRVRTTYRGAIVMLTASQSESDHVAGLDLGADDFVTKPIEPRVLLARIRAQLRRVGAVRAAEMRPGDGPSDPTSLEVGPLHIDFASREVRWAGEAVPVTTMEFDVLAMLARAAGSVVRRDDLYAEILDSEYDGIDRGMDVHVSRIRRKLVRSGFDARRLKSVRGVGYLLACR